MTNATSINVYDLTNQSGY